MNQPRSAKRTRQSTKTTSPAPDDPMIWIRHMGKSLLFTLGIGAALLILLSLGIYFCADPSRYVAPLGLTAAGLTALIGGFLAVRIHGHSALLCGLFNGGLLTLVTLLISLFMKPNASGYSTGIICLLHTLAILLSVAGAYAGLKAPKKKRKNKRK